MNLLRLLFQQSRNTLYAAILSGLICGGCSVGLIALVSSVIEGPPDNAGTLVIIFVSLAVAALISKISSIILLARLVHGGVYHLRLELSRRILRSSLRHLEQTGSARLLAHLTDDVTKISNGLLIAPLVLINAAIVAGCLLYLGWLSMALLSLVVLVLGLAILSYHIPATVAMKHLRQARQEQDVLFGHFRGLIEGSKELKLHDGRSRKFLDEDLASSAGVARRLNVKGLSVFAAAMSWGQMLLLLLIGLLLFGAATWGKFEQTTIAAYVLTLLYMSGPLEGLVGQLPALATARVAFDKVAHLSTDLESGAELALSHSDRLSQFETIELTGIDYIYKELDEDRHFSIGPIDLVIRPGEIVFVTGGNGSGKSTLVKLFTSLYTPDSGRILWDGQPLTQAMQADYRQLFAVIFADFFLFGDLVAQHHEQLDAQAAEYLAKLQLTHKVTTQNGKLSTTALSQGQRKRLALLSAYLDDRPIYIFDEWAADQDPRFKDIFYTELLPELKARGKALIVVSHDDRYFPLADRLLKLEEGRLIEATSESLSSVVET